VLLDSTSELHSLDCSEAVVGLPKAAGVPAASRKDRCRSERPWGGSAPLPDMSSGDLAAPAAGQL